MKSNNPYNLKTIYLVKTEDINTVKGKDGKFHYFYKIENNINNKYYYGVHSTTNINDKYIGSGSILRYAYKKYGFDNFTKYILEFFDDRKSLLEYEKFIVTTELVKDEQCYNMSIGGNANTETLRGRTYFSHTTKDLIRINNSVKNKLIKPVELDKYITEGWVLGQIQKSTRGKVVINKEGFSDRFVYPDEVDEYINQGWSVGGKTRNKGKQGNALNTVWMNNGKKGKRVPKEDVEKYKQNGWIIGAFQRTIKGFIRITNGIEDKNIAPENVELLNYYLNNGWRKGSHAQHDEQTWVNKDGKSLMIKKHEMEKYISDGWTHGHLYKSYANSGKVAVYNDERMIYIQPEELDKYLSEGWKHGNPSNKNNDHEKGKIRINNGLTSKNITKEELDKYLSEGWKKGPLFRKQMKGRIRVTNGLEERMISKEEFETYDKSVWHRGLIKNIK